MFVAGLGSVIRSLMTNTSHIKPYNISPANGSTSISGTPTLSWNCSDADGDPITYTINFGTSTSAGTVSTQTAKSYKPGTLQAGKIYYWRITANDGKGGVTVGDWQCFAVKK